MAKTIPELAGPKAWGCPPCVGPHLLTMHASFVIHPTLSNDWDLNHFKNLNAAYDLMVFIFF